MSIVTYHVDFDELGRCLASLDSPLIDAIYVVDNSSLSSIEAFCSKYPKIRYIAGDNIGYGAAHNKAMRCSLDAGTRYHLVLNSDVYFEPEVIAKLVDYMDANLDVAQVQPNIVYPDGEKQYTCRLLPTPANLIFRRFLPECLVERMNYRYQLKFADHSQEMNVAYHQGSFMFFRTDCFRSVGLFDERFFMYPEDIDITRRMHRHFRTMYYPAATIVHAHRAASYKSKKMLKIHITNMVRYFNKWGWLFDAERRRWNRELLCRLGYKK